MKFMRLNQVWKLINLLKGHKAIENKWVLKIKHKADGTIEKYKAKLVVKSYTWHKWIDYEETFSLIVRFTLICLILVIVMSMDLKLH